MQHLFNTKFSGSDQIFSVHGCQPQRLWHQIKFGYCLRAGILSAAAIVLANCSFLPRVGTTAISCDIIDGKALVSLFKQSPEDMALYLENAFNTTVEQVSQSVTTTNSVVQESYYDWSTETGAYQLATFDLKPRYVFLTFVDEKPTLGRVIECMGAPTYYSLRYGSAGDSRPFVTGELLYTQKGAIVRIQVWNSEVEATGNQQNPVRAVDDSTPVDMLQWVAPNHDIETMDWLAALYNWQPDEVSRLAFRQQNLDYYRSFRPWPGAINQMELTYVAPHLPPALTDESPFPTTETP